jgi:hypothetical protein
MRFASLATFALILAIPASAQLVKITPTPIATPTPSPAVTPLPLTPIVMQPTVPTEWTVRGVVDNAPIQRPVAYPATAAAARTEATAQCNALGAALAPACLAQLKLASFTSPTAGGPRAAEWPLVAEYNSVGGMRSYVIVWAVKK